MLLGGLFFCMGCKVNETKIDKPTSPDENGGKQIVNDEKLQSIGQATMKEDGTIILRLRAETDDGALGEALFTYSPTDEDYNSILKHLGGLEPGESKPVPPWPDD
jgi:hypothetical protein